MSFLTSADDSETTRKSKTHMSSWISVEEALPPYGKWVLVAVEDYVRSHEGYRSHTDDKGEHWSSGGVTHWMPLPELPQKQGVKSK